MFKEIFVIEFYKLIVFVFFNFLVNICVIIDIVIGFNIELLIFCNMWNVINCFGVCEILYRKDVKLK